MADTALASMTAVTTPAPTTDLIYVVQSGPVDRKATPSQYIGNLIVDAANNLAVRSGTTAQVFRIYGTFTDTSNYTRLSLTDDGSGTCTIAAETAGTGADNIGIVITPAGTSGFLIGKAGTAAGPTLAPIPQTGTNAAPLAAVIGGGIGTGSGAGGSLTLATPTTLGTGTTAQTRVARITISQGAVTTDACTITLADVCDVVLSTGTGTKIGTATTQKLGFYNATPIVQVGATIDLGVVLSNLGLRAAGTAYPITTSGVVNFTGGLTVATVGLTITDVDVILSATTGTKIGTATSQKLGFFNATPIVQVGATVDLGVVLSNLGLRAAGTAYPITTSGAVVFTGGVTVNTAGITITDVDIALGTTTGTKIGTATTQKLGFYNAAPVVQGAALTAQLTTITHTAPGADDFAIQALTQSTPFGFVTADEGNTVLKVIANLQARLAEVEARLEAVGLIAAN